MIKNKPQDELLKAYRNGYMTPVNTGGYWNQKERQHLKERFLDGAGISEIALEFQRSENGIVQQLMCLGLLTPPGASRPRRKKKAVCLCKKCEYQDVCPKGGSCVC